MSGPVTTLVALVQGLRARGRIEILPPAGGPTSGRTGADAAALRLGVLGESTAAGCGVDTHEDGFTGALARRLAGPTGSVEWTVVGENGATSRRIRDHLLPQLTGEFDVAVLLAGANDVMTRRSPSAWSEDLRAIVADLSARAGLVVVVGTPPFVAFPSLPRTLANYLADRGDAQDAASQAVCEGFANARFVPSPPSLVDDSFFSRDGFHPGAEGYPRWADLVADAIAGSIPE